MQLQLDDDYSKLKDSECVVCFLKGLGETYSVVKTQILLMDPLPGINRVFSFVLQQERHLNENIGIDTKISINNANQQNQRTNNKTSNVGHGWRNYGRGKGKNYGKQCSFCNKMNHTANECYSKHGFPSWMKQRTNHTTNFFKRMKNARSRMKSLHTVKRSTNKFLKPCILRNFNNLWT